VDLSRFWGIYGTFSLERLNGAWRGLISDPSLTHSSDMDQECQFTIIIVPLVIFLSIIHCPSDTAMRTVYASLSFASALIFYSQLIYFFVIHSRGIVSPEFWASFYPK